MPTTSLEERVTTLECEVSNLGHRLDMSKSEPNLPWWEQIFGSFANSEPYEEAMRLGREYREAQRADGEDIS